MPGVRKIRLGLIFGGKSAEHEVSISSARSIFRTVLDSKKYDLTLILIDKSGSWHDVNPDFFARKQSVKPKGENNVDLDLLRGVDVAFPVLHGQFGEDGTIQGLLEMLGMPYIGSGVPGSAIAMDKVVSKKLMKAAGLPVASFVAFSKEEVPSFEKLSALLGLPFFVKPSRLGSSVGIHKVKNKTSYETALEDGFKFDLEVLAEEYVGGREIECSVLGGNPPHASLPGEIIPNDEFYTYRAKYLSQDGAKLIVPAVLDKEVVKKVQNLARTAFSVCRCDGMARVDFFLRDKGEVVVNEVNTIPGFTPISMYPKLWEASGLPYSALIDRLVELAQKRHQDRKALRTSYF
jgi:D-alanine-D-alanine ligase